MSKLDYTIVVPSRKRSGNMPIIRALLPTAVVCVDAREVDDYSPYIPPKQLLVHPPFDGFGRVMNWIQENVESPVLVEIDDDFQGVLMITGERHRHMTDPLDILAVIENGIRVTQDLELTTFCFARTNNYVALKPDLMPFRAVAPVCAVVGTMGAARHRKYDTSLTGRADMDWTLRTLLEDRLVFCDTRFFFDCGTTFAGRGGSVGLIGPDAFEKTSVEIRRRWGKHISYKQPVYINYHRSVAAIAIRVRRRANTATR